MARRGLGPDRVHIWGLLENNVNQTCASASASIISAGLVAPIPALAILTGTTLPWSILMVWLFTVSSIGVLVGLSLRRQMIEVQRLPFPSGIATAETIREIYAQGREASLRVRYLLGAGMVSAGTKALVDLLSRWLGSGLLQIGPAIGLGTFGLPGLSTRSLGFLVDPSFLMIGFGAIVGFRVGLSLLLGAILAWGVIAPWLFASGRLPMPEDSAGSIYPVAVEFLLWPGVALMVCAALVSFSFSIPGMLRSLRRGNHVSSGEPDELQAVEARPDEVRIANVGPGIPGRWLLLGFGLATLATMLAQSTIFGIDAPVAVLSVLLTFVLAVVAARVSGETGIPPIGALGKVTQLTFGLLHPTNVTENLMTANVTGGAAGQCSDLLHDLKAGSVLGASVRAQAAAQFLGVLVGSVAGSAAYLVLIPDPAAMLMTEQWPSPAVATWMAVAELFRDGIDAAPQGALTASVIGGIVGSMLAMLHRMLPERRAARLPSPVALGLAFVIPASNSISLFLGALAALLARRVAPQWSSRFQLPIAAGLVAGESLAGVAIALVTLIIGQ
jgi:OPT family oligopeptide transporter